MYAPDARRSHADISEEGAGHRVPATHKNSIKKRVNAQVAVTVVPWISKIKQKKKKKKKI